MGSFFDVNRQEDMYFFISDTELWRNSTTETRKYSLALYFRASLITDKIEPIRQAARSDMLWQFFLPFVIFLLILCSILAYLQYSLAKQIMSPIIDLYEKVTIILLQKEHEHQMLAQNEKGSLE